jgi:hypothetical protein
VRPSAIKLHKIIALWLLWHVTWRYQILPTVPTKSPTMVRDDADLIAGRVGRCNEVGSGVQAGGTPIRSSSPAPRNDARACHKRPLSYARLPGNNLGPYARFKTPGQWRCPTVLLMACRRLQSGGMALAEFHLKMTAKDDLALCGTDATQWVLLTEFVLLQAATICEACSVVAGKGNLPPPAIPK